MGRSRDLLHGLTMTERVALIGFGEAGLTFAAAGRWRDHATAFDIDPARTSAMRKAGVTASTSAENTLRSAPIVLSLVTADQALEAAQTCAPYLAKGALWCDMNSVAPETKRAAALVIEEHGGRYVDTAVLAPVHPSAMSVPLLLSGSAARDAQFALQTLGYTNVNIVGDQVGRASAIKMIRSVIVKGIEALTFEMAAAAEAAGVVHEVLASLDASEKHEGWTVKSAYNLERMTTHGLRRAAEMEEAARTLRELGVDPVMTAGTIRRQREAASPKLNARDAA